MNTSWQVVQELELEDINSVPFPSNLAGLYVQPSRRINRRSSTSSSTSTSRSSGYGPYHLRSPAQSLTGKSAKRLSLSPVAEEWEHGFHHTRSVPSRRYTAQARQQSTIGRGQSGLLAEEITMAMMMIPPAHNTKSVEMPKERQGLRSSAKRRLRRVVSFIRGRSCQ
jgi:hypothetical protein